MNMPGCFCPRFIVLCLPSRRILVGVLLCSLFFACIFTSHIPFFAYFLYSSFKESSTIQLSIYILFFPISIYLESIVDCITYTRAQEHHSRTLELLDPRDLSEISSGDTPYWFQIHSYTKTTGLLETMGCFSIRRLVLITIWSSIPSEARQTPSIFARQSSTCPDPTYSTCANTKLPDNFCCPPVSTCLELAGSTTLLCCPAGADCSAIQAVSCDITQQNATLHQNNILKTTALGNAMETCGAGCCPFGFHCNGTICSIDGTQDAKPTRLPASSPTSSNTPITSPTSPSSSPVDTASCPKFPAVAVIAGFFPGLALGVLLTIAGICLLGAHRRKGDRRGSGSSFGNTISEPQPSSTNDMRTDFLRKPPGSPSSTSTRSRSQRVRSLFRKSQASSSSQGMSERSVAPPMPLVVQRGKSGRSGERPTAPRNRLQREPSYEDINIFADGDTASALRAHTPPVDLKPPRSLTGNGNGNQPRMLRGSSQTTFSDMMESSGLAGLRKGEPYVYKGAQTPSTGFSSPPRQGNNGNSRPGPGRSFT
ncbi:hypothetical protein HYALB_00000804 [Hymenoscyphus albidus]|uniref:Uncharacterized protein n=1 Tax=Hymenoscyphus albidus TaxID=595503 RepID=A0A9N9LT37_9HELO|nr:hypothetical protein HYALB_00000804 [Hymenoscyphus albidus]